MDQGSRLKTSCGFWLPLVVMGKSGAKKVTTVKKTAKKATTEKKTAKKATTAKKKAAPKDTTSAKVLLTVQNGHSGSAPNLKTGGGTYISYYENPDSEQLDLIRYV